MGKRGYWIRFLAVAAGYSAAFFLVQRVMPISLASPWFVIVAMVCFLGLAFVAHPVVPIRMPRSLRRVRTWEVDGGLYRTLAVPAFGRLLRRTPLRLFNTDVYLGPGARDMGQLAARLEAAEASHFWAAVLVFPYMVRAALLGSWGPMIWVTLAQALINVYPIMHLRLARRRLDRLAFRQSRPRVRSG